MSDLNIPYPSSAPLQPSYRPGRPGMDRGTRRMLLTAGGLGALLLAGMGVWTLRGHEPAAVPVIEADGRPLRVKPDNPGGMQVVGADEQTSTARGMAPAAEVPAPQALRAQQGTPAVLSAPPSPVVIPPPALGGVTQPAAQPAPATQPAPAVQSAAAPRPAVAGGATLVQLAAVDNEAAAQAEWQRLAKRMPELLGDRRVVVQRSARDGKPIWRVRTGGFTDIADATGFCARVRAKGANCSIASF